MSDDTPDTTYTRTFRRAIDSLGGADKLAKALGASLSEIEGSSGALIPPPGAFLGAIDIVANNGLRASGKT